MCDKIKILRRDINAAAKQRQDIVLFVYYVYVCVHVHSAA